VFCFLLLLPSSLLADEEKALETQQEKESYSIGYQVGLSLKSDEVEVNFETLMQGLQDAIAGQEGLLSNEEMRSLIVERREKVKNDQMQKLLAIRAQNADEAANFLEENGQKEGVKTTDSGLQYLVINEGEGGSPEPGDMVTVHYRGTFLDGKEFDSSYSRGEPQTLQPDGVIQGWREALQMMKVGSKWKIFVPPMLAYGRGGVDKMIPPNKLLIFEIELLAIEKQEESKDQQG
jgi:FKBP-type peptidyl-prolyl cis-trans isomerase FklB